MLGKLFLIILIGLAPISSAFAQNDSDVLGLMLDSVGFNRSDIGFHEKGYWNRYPLDVPYKLTSFEDLYREPFKLYDYSKTMANSVKYYLDSAMLDTASISLYHLTYLVGIDRKLGGFRDYSANLREVADSVRPLLSAVWALYDLAADSADYPSFAAKSPKWKEAAKSIQQWSEEFPANIQMILGRLVINIADVIYWRNLAFRNCDPATMQRVLEIDSLALTQADGNVYHPELDDIAACIDYSSLHYAALKLAAIVEQTADSLIYYDFRPESELWVKTPYGDILIIPSFRIYEKENTYVSPDNPLLIIDDAHNHRFELGGGEQSIDNSVFAMIDLGGDDLYTVKENSKSASYGGAKLGVSVMYDAAGNDTYIGKEYTQGAGLFGVGILFDKGGNDKYKAELSSQGCGYFGIGLCFDVAGNDSFYIYGSGQGFGGIGGGVGVLADYSGDDVYIGEKDPAVFDLADYHSQLKINGNGVQGVGFGRRGDMTDGHAWAGGLGAIIDISGDDHYLSGNWSLGTAYWFSTGIAYDGDGNDVYESCYFTQGSGAHYCNGILIDEGGDDRHELYETAGAALGFGWDWTNAFLINCGGNDIYRANMISMGLSQIRSNAFLIDIGGDDKYYLKQGAAGLGEASSRVGFDKPRPLTPYPYYCKSFGGFIDIGGADEYISFTDSSETEHSKAANNTIWLAPAKGDSLYGANNFGVGIDIESGVIPELEIWK